MAVKSFFATRTAAQMQRAEITHGSQNLVDRILELEPDTTLVVDRDIIQERYQHNARKHMKHAPTVKVRRYGSIDEVIESVRRGELVSPVWQREAKFNAVRHPFYSGYSFKPVRGTDRRTRKISLVECLNAAWSYAEMHQAGEPGKVRPYDNAAAVLNIGADVFCTVPSRTEGREDYEFIFRSVPVIDWPTKYVIGQSLATDHACGSTRFNIRYRYAEDKEDSRLYNFCAHEIAAYMNIMDYYKTQHGSWVQLSASPFALPTSFTVEYYKKLCNNVLIKDVDTSGDEKFRKLRHGEKEVLLWALVMKHGHRRTFFVDREQLRDYDWKIAA